MLQLHSVILCILILEEYLARTAGEKIFECTNNIPSTEGENQRQINLTCSGGRVLHIKEAQYGRSQENICIQSSEDCLEHVTIADDCCGLENCVITIKNEYSFTCSGFASFFRLDYHCTLLSASKCPKSTVIETSPRGTEDTVNGTIMGPISDSQLLSKLVTESVTMTSGDDPARKISQKEADNEDLAIILGSAALVALLLASIITIIFLLRKYQWQSEKECFLQIFVGMCKREPPDGSEDPDGMLQRTNRNQGIQCLYTAHSPAADWNTQSNRKREQLQSAITTEDEQDMELNTNDKRTPNRKRKRNAPSPEVKVLMTPEVNQNRRQRFTEESTCRPITFSKEYHNNDPIQNEHTSNVDCVNIEPDLCEQID